MLDFIFAVSHADHWHSINMNQNPSHYPLAARLAGSGLVSRLQNTSAGLWFNPYAKVNGVVSISSSLRVQSSSNLQVFVLDHQIWRDQYRKPHLRPPHMAHPVSRRSNAQAHPNHQRRPPDPTHPTSQPRFSSPNSPLTPPRRIHRTTAFRKNRLVELSRRCPDEWGGTVRKQE